MVRTQVGIPPVRHPARVFTAVGRSCSEGDRVELASRLGTMVAQLQPPPDARDWLQIVRDAE